MICSQILRFPFAIAIVVIIIVILMLFKCAALLSHRNIPFSFSLCVCVCLCYYSVLECVYLWHQQPIPRPGCPSASHCILFCSPARPALLFALQVIYRFAICLCARLQFIVCTIISNFRYMFNTPNCRLQPHISSSFAHLVLFGAKCLLLLTI